MSNEYAIFVRTTTSGPPEFAAVTFDSADAARIWAQKNRHAMVIRKSSGYTSGDPAVAPVVSVHDFLSAKGESVEEFSEYVTATLEKEAEQQRQRNERLNAKAAAAAEAERQREVTDRVEQLRIQRQREASQEETQRLEAEATAEIGPAR